MFLDGIDLTKEYVDAHLDEIKNYLTETKKADDWDEVKRVQNLIRTVDPTNRRVLADLTYIAKREAELEDDSAKRKQKLEIAKDLHLERLRLHPDDFINIKGLYSLAWKLKDLDLLQFALRKVTEIDQNNSKSKRAKNNVSYLKYQIKVGKVTDWTSQKGLEDGEEIFITPVLEKEELFSKTIPEDETGVSELREQLYGGEISQEKFLELVDSYSDSTQGIIFLAEGCMYFKNPISAQKALNGYRKTHQSVQTSELKAINQAMGIVKSKQRIVDPKKWERIYVALNKALQELDER